MPRLQEAERLEALATQIRSCAQCPLHATRTKAVPGEGMPSARVMLIGEAPGRDEDQRGQPFVGASGRFLDEMLAGSGVNSVNEVRGRVIEHNNRKYLAGYHPAASFYREDMAENIRQDFALLRQELQKLAPLST